MRDEDKEEREMRQRILLRSRRTFIELDKEQKKLETRKKNGGKIKKQEIICRKT